MTTGIPILDAILKIFGAIFLTILLISSWSRLVSMFHKHAYAQLVGSLIFFGIAYAFVATPDKVTGIFSKLWDAFFSKV